MNAPALLALYNQTFRPDEEFLASFVARGDVTDFLLARLRQTKAADVAEAQLLVGGRGMGKTSLLRRVAIGVAADEVLSTRFVPLRFREEQYNVLTLADFWRNSAESLAEWCETNRPGSDFPDNLDRLAASPEGRDAETVFSALSDTAKAVGLRPLLLVDNLDIVISNISAQENWALRRALQEPGGPVLIAAATHVPEQTGDREAAFYEFFRLHLLSPLSADELIACLRRLAEGRGERGAAVAQIVDTQPQRLRALHVFTGGNPRVLALIYRLLETQSTHEALADLEALLDQLTPYYKGRVEEYQTKLQRAVIDALALNWDPISAHDLSAATGVEVTTISSQLTRLRNDGLIEEVELAGARAGYQMVERLFNIWYLMRHGTRKTRNRVTWLTKFLVLFYPAEELRRMAAGAESLGEWTREAEYYREALAGAIEAMNSQTVRLMPFRENVEDEEALALMDEIIVTSKAGRFGDVIAATKRLRRFARVEPLSEAWLSLLFAIFSEALALRAVGRVEGELAAYDELLAHLNELNKTNLRDEIKELDFSAMAALALVNKGERLGEIGRAVEAIAVYDEAIERYSGSNQPDVDVLVAKALVFRGARLSSIGRKPEAIASFDETLARFSTRSEAGVRQMVLIALVFKAACLSELGREAEAVAVFDMAISRCVDVREPASTSLFVIALAGKGRSLGKLGRAGEAVAAFDQALARYADKSDSALHEIIANLLANKGQLLAEVFGRFPDAAEAISRALVLRPELPAEVTISLIWSNLALGEANKISRLLQTLSNAPEKALNLIEAGLALVSDNVGTAMTHLDRALTADLSEAGLDTDLIRCLRLAHMRGFGEKLIAHFVAAGHAERLAPVYAALVAMVRGERQLLNFNPETRGPAEAIYRRLVAPLRAAEATVPKKPAARRGRPPKRRGR